MSDEKLNCWEWQKCGREPGGNKVDTLGVCVAAASSDNDGVNEGTNAGRFCWAVAGTLCGGKVNGTIAQKLGNCMFCKFYYHVIDTEGQDLVLSPVQLECTP